MSWHWAWRHLCRHPGQAILAVAGVAVTAALLLDMLMLAGGIERSFERLLLVRGYQIRITPAGTLPFDTEATLGDVDRLLATVRSDPDVASAGAVLGFAPFLVRDDGRERLIGYGVQPDNQGIYQLLRGTDLVPTDTAGVLLAEPTARSFGLSPGDTLRLVANLDPQSAAVGATRLLTVRGVVQFLYDARNQHSIAVALPVARAIDGPRATDRASVILVRTVDQTVVEAVAARLAAAWPEAQVAGTASLRRQFQERLTYFRQLSIVLATIALAVTVLLVGTLLTITVNERMVEIATMRAIGVSRATIIGQVVAHGALLVLGGTVLGTGLGLVTARWLDRILTAFPGLPASVSFFVPAAGPLLLGAVVLLASGLGSGAWPAWRAASAPLTLTLREDGA